MKNRLISFLLVVLTLLGAMILPAAAADDESKYLKATDNAWKAHYDEIAAKLTEEIKQGYTDLYAQTDKYQLFCNKYTGEVYLRDRGTGQYLTTNPIDVGNTSASKPSSQQEDRLSQVWLTYRAIEGSSGEVSYNSFKYAAERGQISVSRTRDGIRVEYTMGDVTSRFIAPQAILDSDFRESILYPFEDRIIGILNYDNLVSTFSSFINTTDPDAKEVYERLRVLEEPELPVEPEDPDDEAAMQAYEAAKEKYDAYWDLRNNPDAFQATIKEILGTPKTDKFKNDNVNSRFRYDYKVKRESIEERIKNGTDEQKAAAEEEKLLVLEQLRESELFNITSLKMPSDSTVGKTLNNVYADFGSLAADYKKVVNLNLYYDENGNPLTDENSKKQIDALKKKYSVLNRELAPGETYPLIRTLDYDYSSNSEAATINYFKKVQNYFVKSIEGYTLSKMVAQEEKVGFEAIIFDNPLFRCALEYTLDETGVTVDVPTSSIVFDESKYELVDFSFLRYFGAGKTENVEGNDGYIFYPDGSGALIYNTTLPTSAVMKQPIYSVDYAFTNLLVKSAGDSISSSQPIRLPVFGAVNREKTETGYSDRHVGYLAIITEGETLAKLYAAHTTKDDSDYVNAYASYTYRSTDNYSIGRLGGSTVSISADFRYDGYYTQKYVMLTDDALNGELGEDHGRYRADYVGMADAYRDYLFGRGELKALSEEELKARLPLYIETYATVETVESILSFPVEVDKPLTTFGDVEKIGDDLRKSGIGNVKFRLIGYYNGGFQGYYPNRIKWMKAAGGKKGFKSLTEYVEQHQDDGFEAFTDVDLLYNYKAGKIGSISRKKNQVRSMSDQYVRKHVYSTIYRTTTSNMGLLISASRLTALFNKFDKKFKKFNSTAISLANVASDLSSNFNEDDFFTRQEAKTYVAEFLDAASKKGSGKYTVMSTGGNVYTLPYIDYLLSAPVDGSHYNYVSRTIPFFGMVMHGSLQYAGEIFNEAGNPDYEILRDVESGAGLYAVLVYREDNANLMKEDSYLIEHYSAKYSLWKDDLVAYFDLLDYAIGDLQTWTISDHRFLAAERRAQDSEREEAEQMLEQAYYDELEKEYKENLSDRTYFLRALWYYETDPATREKNFNSLAENLISSKGVSTYSPEPVETILAVMEALRAEDEFANMAEKKLAQEAFKRMIDPASEYCKYSTAYGQKVKITVDVDAIIADAEAQLKATVSQEFRDKVALFKEKNEYTGDDGVLELNVTGIDTSLAKNDFLTAKSNYMTESEATDPKYKTTNYTINDGSVVLVTYSDGTDSVRFLLNFSIFNVTVNYEGTVYTLEKHDFIRLDPRKDGTPDPRRLPNLPKEGE